MSLCRRGSALALCCLSMGIGIAAMTLGSSRAEEPKAKPNAIAAIRFNRDIRPILSENCFACHGPDPAARKADLRLDRETGLFGKRESGETVVKGKPDESWLYLRVASDDPEEVMPPPSSHKTLNPEQKGLIRDWIAQGATWEPHWSLVKPERPAPPSVKNEAWVRDPIDRFILAKIEEAGLTPAPEADRRAIGRRLALDLTGLPPEPADLNAFVNDAAPNAYETYVDKLLASPAWGEHRGRYWLDAARYGDTHGLHIDNYREIWPYRDWVIRAFNRNLPFDQFTIQQIAGDLLPDRTLDQQIATGFHRCNITTNEGGSIPEEVAAIYAKDRVETTFTVWMGLTAGCASCHDHKFDPIAQKEFYQFAAFFRNTTQNPMDGNIRDTPPIIFVPQAADQARWKVLVDEAKTVEAEKAKRVESAKSALESWLKTNSAAILATGPIDPAKLETSSTAAGDFATGQAFALSLRLVQSEKPADFVIASKADDKGRGWKFEIAGQVPVFTMTGDRPEDKIVVKGNASAKLKPSQSVHLAVSYDGGRDDASLKLYADGKPVAAEPPTANALQGEVRNSGALKLTAPNGGLRDVRFIRGVLLPEDAVAAAKWDEFQGVLASGQLKPEQRGDLERLQLARADESYRKLSSRLTEIERDQRPIRKRGSTTHVMQEQPGQMPIAKVLFRGQYDQPRDEVPGGVPASLHPFPSDAPRNRLGLAQWLVHPDNSLTARVTVNRYWQELFGIGLVRSSEDFGIMGENPSHPELLDWLAVEFRESGWDVKRLFKRIVMSASYRQSPVATPEKLKRDPGNRLLARGSRYRMDGEMVRDMALATSGLLVRKIGGPSVRPYQPPGVWEAVAMDGSDTRFYKQDQGEGLYRRSMYTFWKRSAPPASMDIFNAPSRENCIVRRERTNTPLQALVTLNDVQFVEAARNLAQRALKEGGADFNGRLDFVALRVLGRTFADKERAICRSALEEFQSRFAAQPEEAKKLIRTGESPAAADLSPADLASWTLLASQVMNLDEALNK